MKYRKGIFILTYRIKNNKINYLLLRRKLHWIGWEFPKGGLDKKESILRAIKRELKEETNLIPIKITNHKLSGKYKYNKKIACRKEKGQTYTLYSALVKNNKVKLDKKEHSDYKWVDYNQALETLTWPNQRKCLKIVDKFISESL